MTTTIEILTKSPFNSETFVDGQKEVPPGNTQTLGWKVYSGIQADECLVDLEVTNIENVRTIINAGDHTEILEAHNDYRDYIAKSLLPKGETIFRVRHTIPYFDIKPSC